MRSTPCARANLAALCQSHLKGRCENEIVDVFREPQRALAEGIFMTPTLKRHGAKSAVYVRHRTEQSCAGVNTP
jgi:hypothetical protein